MYKPGKANATRMEFRCPDPAANPYLAFAVMLAAGMKGMKEKYVLGGPIEEDIFEMTPDERESKGIDSLPGSLGEAIPITEKSELVREALGDHIFEKFISNKKIEWDKYRTHVSKFELEKFCRFFNLSSIFWTACTAPVSILRKIHSSFKNGYGQAVHCRALATSIV
jgi:glutamine synthetase